MLTSVLFFKSISVGIKECKISAKKKKGYCQAYVLPTMKVGDY